VGGGVAATALAHITGNNWFASYYHTSTVNHTPCIPCARVFWHILVIMINFSAQQSTKIRFQDQKSKIWRRGTAPSHRGIKEGPSQSQRHIQGTCPIRPPMALDPPSCFCTIRGFEHRLHQLAVLLLQLQLDSMHSCTHDFITQPPWPYKTEPA